MNQQPNKGAPVPKRTQPEDTMPPLPAANGPDTAPEDPGAPAADTDLPIDGEVRNDAVLRGEEHADEKIPPATDEERAKK
ncbi:hypothetical protein [Paraflavitalea sp. CAU 1676]|uniref:hypothetical protein n=1 Tax=Paraflavitalea sp. CAU 1676 TaxID=3032598 RepID=UPI0023D9E075|nr:hypothetical protein [Paraflavitalea sp. CAU 1676]MDF2193442.1 hypothetical protein [Paraflavitalea sp. CAU 1676]